MSHEIPTRHPRSPQGIPAPVAPVYGGEAESAWRLTWDRFRRNPMAIAAGVFLLAAYLIVVFADTVAPYPLQMRHRGLTYAPPQTPKFIDNEGRFHLRPFVYGYNREIDPDSLRRTYTLDYDERLPIYLFVRSEEPYFLFNIRSWATDIRLFGTAEGSIHLLGTDRQGRDMLSRIVYGSRVSLTIGLVGVLITIVIGSVMGVVSGYFGGRTDNIVQRFLEVLMAFPQIPLWMALAASLPQNWSPIQTYFIITIILSLVGWPSLARQLRGMVLSLRDSEFILAVHALGAQTSRVLMRHLLPNCASHVIVVATLSIPNMILAETSLSFLGLGIRPPMTSWGVLLQEAQNVRTLALHWWLMLPSLPVVAVVLAYNFLGDGLRDAADPYSNRT